jgi:hypothetical protein
MKELIESLKSDIAYDKSVIQRDIKSLKRSLDNMSIRIAEDKVFEYVDHILVFNLDRRLRALTVKQELLKQLESLP